ERRSAVRNLAARYDLQAFCLRDGIRAPVRLEVSDYHVDTLGFQCLRLVQHAVGLTHARRVPEVYLQASAAHACSPCGNKRISKSSARSISLSIGLLTRCVCPRNI